MNAEFRYFGTDEYKESFVVFEIDRENEKNAFVWVYIDEETDDSRRIEVSAVSRLYSYLNHEVSPFYVKEDDEAIDKALDILEKCPSEVLNDKLKAFDERYSMANEKYLEEWDKTEQEMYEEVMKAKETSGYWPWNPKGTED